MQENVKKYFLKTRFIVLGLLIACFSILGFFKIRQTYSEKTTSTVWDGTIATSFAYGTGTVNDPFIISNGSELAYFFQEINGIDSSTYFNKYYALDNNINLNNYDFSQINTLKTFSGHLEGNGYIISNFTLNTCDLNTNENVIECSLFHELSNASIENLNIMNASININNLTNNTRISLISDKARNTTLRNISLSNITLNAAYNWNYQSYISGVINTDNGNNTLTNVHISLDTNNTTNRALLFYTHNNSNINTLINKETEIPIAANKTLNPTRYTYNISNNNISFTNNYPTSSVLEILNSTSTLEWAYANNTLRLRNSGIEENPVEPDPSVITEHASGVSNGVVYINDLVSDANYYTGLNFTYSTNRQLPTTENKNIYNSSNLVRTQITYNSRDYSRVLNNNNGYIGYTSSSESYDKYVYYKIYPVNTNGTSDLSDDYIELDLIDNPFARRPNNRAFNGWTTTNNDILLTIDRNLYIRKARIHVTYTDGVPDDIIEEFYATWTKARHYNLTSSGNFTNAFSYILSSGLTKTKGQFSYYDMSNIYERGTISRNSYYTMGDYYQNYGNYYREVTNTTTRCNRSSCTYYRKTTDSSPQNGKTYYSATGTTPYTQFSNANNIQQIQVDIDNLDYGEPAAGYFRKKTIPQGRSIVGFYDSNVNLITTGTCNSAQGCEYYELIRPLDMSGNEEITSENEEYYFLVTRDTNIITMGGNIDGVFSGQSKPFTFTAIDNNGQDRSGNYYWNIGNNSIKIGADTRIEHMRIRSNTATQTNDNISSNSNATMYAEAHNLKIGRGITKQNNSYTNFDQIVGVSEPTGSRNKYTFVIESGYYNNLSLTTAYYSSSNSTYTLQVFGTYGNDLDRVNNNNTNLDIRYCASGSYYGTINTMNNNEAGLNTTIKSGTFGSNNADYAAGVYIGGRQNGSQNTLRKGIIEGGYIHNLIGGPLSVESFVKSGNTYLNDTEIRMKGGIVDVIIGGAGVTATHGNRVIQVTGGQVNYAVVGGSNGVAASDTAKINGDSYVYIGGNAKIGNDNINPGTLDDNSDIPSGSVFGAGNGSSSNDTYGSVNNSNVIIDGNATIRGNVYGGGNYGGTGVNNTNTYNNSTTKVKILNGHIEGSVYGGANRNASGKTNINNTTTVEMYNGTVDNGIYGGSNISGIIYGSTSVSIYGGNVHDIYGGGEGNNTFVRDDVSVVIGTTETINQPVVTGSIYGGSAFGTVNATTTNAAANNHTTTVTVNNGNITGVTVGEETTGGSVFGGGKGNGTYTPYVKGNITVNINGGTINNVFGGFDDAGTPQGSDYVYLNGGVIGKSFGGGNNTSLTTTHIYLQGAQTEYLFGGSNNNGAITTSNVTITSGQATYAFGGNNLGGSCNTSNISMSNGTITNSLFGGGNAVATSTTNVTITGAEATIPYVYGGGNQAGISTKTNVTTSNVTITELYGGSNQSGDVAETNPTVNSGNITKVFGGNNSGGTVTLSKVKINNGTIGKVYGGNNLNGSTTTTNVTIENGGITNVFGGGSQTSCTTTNVTIKGGTIGDAFGGSDSSGNITTSNITATNTNGNLQVSNIYGGNNAGGETTTANATINSGTIGNVYGGGYLATTNATNVEINGGNITDVFGGGNQAIVTTNTNLEITAGTIENAFGGGNNANVNGNTNVSITGSTINHNVFGGGNNGKVEHNTTVNINNAAIHGSAYAGGNGAEATVKGNTNIAVGGTTVIGTQNCAVPANGSVFGGGNAAFTGTSGNNNSHANVQIAGGTFYGNIYGGANTSVVYGDTEVEIGYGVTSTDVTKSNVHIYGTVFGAGEANASGSETYDFHFISVTNGVIVNIDGQGTNDVTIDGSIFGSGNASSSQGDSIVTISNYGTSSNVYKTNISIQRATVLTINNSHLRLLGASDRTNEYSDVPFGLSRIDQLIIKGGTSLYLDNGCNLVKEFNSQTSNGATAAVSIEEGTITKNVDNRLYIRQGQVVNILKSEDLSDYGDVYGMTFFGMYKVDNNTGVISVGMYGDYANGATLPDDTIFEKSSYVLGAHKSAHDIEVDGFYSNFENEETGLNDVLYIEPTPPSSAFYMWTIGEGMLEYELNLTASKYSTLGSVEFRMPELADPNTTFEILDFDATELEEGVSIAHKNNIPRIAETDEEADNVIGLAIESAASGWLTNGTTNFITSSPYILGTTEYVGDNSPEAPAFLVYLYHSKNLATQGDMGTAKIYMQAITKIDDLKSQTVRLVLKININRILYTTNDYEAAITPGRKYELFPTSATNISSKSSISAYFALFASAEPGQTIYKTGYHRALVTDYVLPLNTKITMIDMSGDENKYYYHVINQTDVTNATQQIDVDGEATYQLSIFETMGAYNSTVYYDDAQANIDNYDATNRTAAEEFIFIIDFENTNITENALDKTLLIELENSQNEAMISVLDIEQRTQLFSIYANHDAIIDIDGELSSTRIYTGEKVLLDLQTEYTQQKIGGLTIYDTHYFESKEGIKISLINKSTGEVVSSSSLLGLSYKMDEKLYHPNIDGTTRMKIADKVGNVRKWINIDTGTSNIATGEYTLRIEAYASSDGIYYGLTSNNHKDFDIYIVNEIYGLNLTTTPEEMVISSETGLNQNNENTLTYNVEYNSGITDPHLRIKMYRRTYTSPYDTTFEEVNILDYISNELTSTNNLNEYLIVEDPNEVEEIELEFKEDLVTGTYKLEFILCDTNTQIGIVEKYIIIK